MPFCWWTGVIGRLMNSPRLVLCPACPGPEAVSHPSTHPPIHPSIHPFLPPSIPAPSLPAAAGGSPLQPPGSLQVLAPHSMPVISYWCFSLLSSTSSSLPLRGFFPFFSVFMPSFSPSANTASSHQASKVTDNFTNLYPGGSNTWNIYWIQQFFFHAVSSCILWKHLPVPFPLRLHYCKATWLWCFLPREVSVHQDARDADKAQCTLNSLKSLLVQLGAALCTGCEAKTWVNS